MKSFTLTLWTLLLIVAAQPAAACSVCFREDPASPFTLGLKLAVLSLFGVLLSVVIPLAKFFLSVRRRSREEFNNLKPTSY